MSRRSFLTAQWRHLILANYFVPEELLHPLLPPGLELDRRGGRCWASLVGFQFLDTRVLGIGWPGFRHFPEWNLRFYVKEGERRGVCFVREFGAKPAMRPEPESVEHFFKEHSWGYGTSRRGELIRYEVNHPEWDVYPVREFAADLDWGLLYGPEWTCMNEAHPESVLLAVGSDVNVYPRG